HVDGRVDPVKDIEIVKTELLLADLETLEKRKLKAEKAAKAGDRTAARAMEVYHVVEDALGRGIPVHTLSLGGEAEAILKELHLLSAKKVLYVANVSEQVLREDGHYIKQVKEMAAKEGARVVVICGDLEAEMAELPLEERQAFLADLGLEESGLVKLIREGYALLGLITFYTTVGPELRAWTIPQGTRAPQAAGKIHSDMERGFIRAEIINFTEFVSAGGMLPAREKGWIRSEGKDYVIRDGDIALFRFNV
ncbi:MAG: YchF family ATPase, partial [Syntrophales bacterium]|nr:YchF family ATPase [Syntrophales bacterium]